MSKLATTRMSSRGQVVIAEDLRRRLGLSPGVRFLVIGDKGVVILKTLSAPAMSEFNDLVREARRQARKAGLKRRDVADAVSREKQRR